MTKQTILTIARQTTTQHGWFVRVVLAPVGSRSYLAQCRRLSLGSRVHWELALAARYWYNVRDTPSNRELLVRTVLHEIAHRRHFSLRDPHSEKWAVEFLYLLNQHFPPEKVVLYFRMTGALTLAECDELLANWYY